MSREAGDQTAAWVVYRGDSPIGAGAGPHAAIADAVRRTGLRHSLDDDRVDGRLPGTTCRPVGRGELEAARARLPGRGLTLAEHAWCQGTMANEPVEDVWCDVAAMVLAAAAIVDPEHRRDGATVKFGDGSTLETTTIERPEGPGRLIRLPVGDATEVER